MDEYKREKNECRTENDFFLKRVKIQKKKKSTAL